MFHRDQLPPGSTIDQVLHHEVSRIRKAQIPNSLVAQVKELGTHILVCEVSYNSSNAVTDKLSFRKFFKFQVLLLNRTFSKELTVSLLEATLVDF